MSIDYAEKEREFIENLQADTGRDLEQWMAAITARGNVHRNDIIDWLRQHRFTFSKASWLERIHHNGGRPIYAEKPDLKALAAEAFNPPPGRSSRAANQAKPATAEPVVAVEAPRLATPASPIPVPLDTAGAESLDALLAKGKAFRPLAQYLLKTITGACPAATIGVRGGLVTCGATSEFAVIAVSARELRLGLALGGTNPRDGLTAAKITGAGPHITHMAVLTDARQIGQVLTTAIYEAHTQVQTLAKS